MMDPSKYFLDQESKLKLLANLLHEINTNSPSALKHLLKDYKYLFEDEGNVKVKDSLKCIDTSCQTDTENNMNQWNPSSIVEDVTGIAKQVTLETGFNYDENSGWYFDERMNCYYNPNYRLYYYRDQNAYYYYDDESRELKFYCSLPSQVDSSNLASQPELMSCSPIDENIVANQDPQPSGINKSPKAGCNLRAENKEGESSTGEGEVQSHIPTPSIVERELNLNPNPAVIEAGPTVFEPENTKHFAPCIRVVVTSSTLPSLTSGTLFIVTCTGGTLGREGNHDVLIPDQLISKMHCKFQYVLKDGLYIYEIIDLGSKNGTYVDGKRLSDSLVQSRPATITHGSVITVGRTDLLCHIHPQDETCQDCTTFSSFRNGHSHDFENSTTLKKKHNLEASFLRKKFGIDHSSTIKLPQGYEDRSEVRRKQVGSSHSSEKTETASINEPICKKNKGYTLLSKMGWKEGDTIGKRNEGAILEPVQAVDRIHNKSGLGCDATSMKFEESKKSDIAMKTFERYNEG